MTKKTLREELFETAKKVEEANKPLRKQLVDEYLTSVCKKAASEGNFSVEIGDIELSDGKPITTEEVKKFAKENSLDYKRYYIDDYILCSVISFK